MNPAAVHHGVEKLRVPSGLRHNTRTPPIQNLAHPATPSKRNYLKHHSEIRFIIRLNHPARSGVLIPGNTLQLINPPRSTRSQTTKWEPQSPPPYRSGYFQCFPSSIH